ncbi:MAG: DUF2326 domain-containing protein [Firmicutes bacterium HGW-Firmicutes-17]|jgi:uncharacterized protein YydD (DUF2326 family)|nr:MAG: DUF2326 domain-containing protein [Firmicutes bacterium HGW-Firmicutes-17]
MFIKSLKISTPDSVIRDLTFSTGLNLIIDKTPTTNEQLTGNNVGKTTVLKLVDFCLGAKSAIIFSDTEDKKSLYQEIKDFLIDNKVLITLVLTEKFNSTARTLTVERNFLSKKGVIRRINGEDILEREFEDELLRLLIPHQKAEKPSFRQIISHNIRYKDESINNTIKTLNRYTSDVEYEALYLFLLGCIFDDGARKQAILSKIKQEETFKERLEKKQTKTSYEIALSLLEDEISELNKKKSTFNLNENFEKDLDELNLVKYRINRSSSLVSNLNIRRNLIIEAQQEMEQNIANIDIGQLQVLYLEATQNVAGIQKTFENLVSYHNNMLIEKARYIGADLPLLEEKLKAENITLTELLTSEKLLSERISKGDSFAELEKIIGDLNEKYRIKGEYESIISQLEDAEENIANFNNELQEIDSMLFSHDFENVLKTQIKKFNKHFSSISNELYGEKYALKYDKVINKKGQQVYQFSSFNLNMSSGKKQGEILCFDLAYIAFADEENLSCLHFLLNDKKELMHDNQLNRVAEYVKDKEVQLVISILKDKLPDGLIQKSNVVVELSQDSKLFKMEEY